MGGRILLRSFEAVGLQQGCVFEQFVSGTVGGDGAVVHDDHAGEKLFHHADVMGRDQHCDRQISQEPD